MGGCRDVTVCIFFFQAEDGIRDLTVTGVQTCALPISGYAPRRAEEVQHGSGIGGPADWRSGTSGARRDREISGDDGKSGDHGRWVGRLDRKSTRLNSSHSQISYAVFCLKKQHTTTVCIVGDFNDWDAARTPMRPSPRGGPLTTAVVPLAPGRYRYAFLLDGYR